MINDRKKTIQPDIFELSEKLAKSANKTLSFFEKKLESDGSYGKEVKDISSYFKSPMLFISSDKPQLAEKILFYIRQTFLLKNGDLANSESLKSAKGEYIEYWSYINGWIIRAVNYLNNKDFSSALYDYLINYYVGKDKGFITHNINSYDGITDILSTAHHGLIHLEMGNNEIAISAGNYLCYAIDKQPDIENRFYLKFDKDEKPITAFSKDSALFSVIEKNEPMQLYFMIGYPCAYLAILFENMGEMKFLKAAQLYLDFALSCDISLYKCNFSHKIAWAASILYKITQDQKYLIAIEKITDYFISTQSDKGIWYTNADINTQLDQSAEIACWFLNIHKNLINVKNEYTIEKIHDEKYSNITFKLK
jgi:hypothetical protein